jgi:galactose-1-phosphate uridylyltransferase
MTAMAEIRFEMHEDALDLLNPMSLFQPDHQHIEVRRDPLLGHTSIYNPALRDKAKILFGDIDRDWLGSMVAASAERCIFCPGRHDNLPKYPPELLPEGRIRVGEATLFPNLFGLARYHAVVTVSEAHFLELREFTATRVGNALLAMQRFMAAVARTDASARFATLNANYLFPAGASIIHPHFQLLSGPQAYGHHAMLLTAWRTHLDRTGSSYADDLVGTEQQQGERYIGGRGGWHWLAAYAPLGNLEIQAFNESIADFTRLDEAGLSGLAEGIAAMLGLYEVLGYLSFNFSLYAQREEEASGARLFLRLIARQNPAPGYRCDDYFLQKLLQSDVILMPPEELARQARPCLENH